MKADVIIMGAGPNGLAAALALGGSRLRQPLTVLVLDGRDPRRLTEDHRGTALTQASQNMFKALGVWPSLAPHTAEMRDVMVTDATGQHDGRPTLLSFATASDRQAAACIVENRPLNAALLAAVEASPAITLEGGFGFKELDVQPGHVVVTATSGQSRKATLLVAADGRNSPVRSALGIEVTRKDFGQSALTFSITHSSPHDNLAEEHFSPDGVFAVLPLPGHASSIVWGTSPAHASALMALADAEFNNVLQEQMGTRLGMVMLKGGRAAYPLVSQIANSLIGPRVALLGDAAHAIHPLAGLGLNLGYKDAAALADCVAQASARGDDLGGAATLQRYEQARRFDTFATATAMEAMNGLFMTDNPVLKLVRDGGLRMIDRLPRAKDFLMQQAAGTTQDNPRLLRGLLPG